MNEVKKDKILQTQSQEFRRFYDLLQTHVFYDPIKIKKKSAFLLFFVKKGFTITLSNSIHIDTGKKLSVGTLFHEAQHYIDQCKLGKDGLYHRNFWRTFKFYITYTFPQNLALLSLLAIFAIWYSKFFLLSFLFLGALLPIPSFNVNRKNHELRGYFWSWLVDKRTSYSATFANSSYYFMDYSHSDTYYQQVFRGFQSRIMTSNQYPKMQSLYNIYVRFRKI